MNKIMVLLVLLTFACGDAHDSVARDYGETQSEVSSQDDVELDLRLPGIIFASTVAVGLCLSFKCPKKLGFYKEGWVKNLWRHMSGRAPEETHAFKVFEAAIQEKVERIDPDLSDYLYNRMARNIHITRGQNGVLSFLQGGTGVSTFLVAFFLESLSSIKFIKDSVLDSSVGLIKNLEILDNLGQINRTELPNPESLASAIADAGHNPLLDAQITSLGHIRENLTSIAHGMLPWVHVAAAETIAFGTIVSFVLDGLKRMVRNRAMIDNINIIAQNMGQPLTSSQVKKILRAYKKNFVLETSPENLATSLKLLIRAEASP